LSMTCMHEGATRPSPPANGRRGAPPPRPPARTSRPPHSVNHRTREESARVEAGRLSRSAIASSPTVIEVNNPHDIRADCWTRREASRTSHPRRSACSAR
jgi:hypothetical protein